MSESVNDPVAEMRALILSAGHVRQSVAEHFGIGVTETVALSLLSAGPLTPKELASHTGLTPSTVTALLGRLEEGDLAHRHAHPSDRRKMVVSLGPGGEAFLRRTDEWLLQVLERVEGVDPDEVIRVLRAVRLAIEAQDSLVRELPPVGRPGP